MSKGEIVNKVAESGIVTLDLEQLIPPYSVASIDIKPQLFQGLILREKDFRSWIKEHDWGQYEGKYVALFCSADAVVPIWAYMLITSTLQQYTDEVFYTTPDTIDAMIAEQSLTHISSEDYKGKRVVIKGCGDRDISAHAYVVLSRKLVPVVKSLMYGEPCSTVPVYKQPKK